MHALQAPPAPPHWLILSQIENDSQACVFNEITSLGNQVTKLQSANVMNGRVPCDMAHTDIFYYTQNTDSSMNCTVSCKGQGTAEPLKPFIFSQAVHGSSTEPYYLARIKLPCFAAQNYQSVNIQVPLNFLISASDVRRSSCGQANAAVTLRAHWRFIPEFTACQQTALTRPTAGAQTHKTQSFMNTQSNCEAELPERLPDNPIHCISGTFS